MVHNNTDFSNSLQLLDIQLSIQELPNDDAVQGSVSIEITGKDLSSTGLSPATRVAHQLFSQEPMQKAFEELNQTHNQHSTFKFATFVTVFPSLKELPPTLLSLLRQIWEGGERGGQIGISKPNGESKPSIFPIAGEGLPITLANVRAVLSLLYYFNPVNRELFDAMEIVMKPLIDQLILPINKNSEGETWGGKPSTEPTNPETKTRSSIEKRAPHPLNVNQKPEKSLGDHNINRNQGTENRISNKTIPKQEEGVEKPKTTSPSNPLFKQFESEVPFSPNSLDRASILAAPFLSQYPFFAAPYRKKKKLKDPREQEEDLSEDKEDPFEEDKF